MPTSSEGNSIIYDNTCLSVPTEHAIILCCAASFGQSERILFAVCLLSTTHIVTETFQDLAIIFSIFKRNITLHFSAN